MKPMFIRKVIRIRAEDSPNVRFAQWQIAQGLEPSGEVIVDGVLPWDEYQLRRRTWDEILQCVGLDGEFYKGASVLLFPPVWLNLSATLAVTQQRPRRGNKMAMGVDTGEGGDKTAWAVGDEQGLIYLRAEPTPDTSVIPGITLGLMNEYGVAPSMVMFDRGGGGKEHVDALKSKGYHVDMVGFGDPAVADPTVFIKHWDAKLAEHHERHVYKNKRAQMYHMLRLSITPKKVGTNEDGTDVLASKFGIPSEYSELRRQLTPIPLSYDEEGRIYLLPKKKRDPKDTRPTLTELIGCSPDEADAVALMNYALSEGLPPARGGALW